MYLIDGRVDDSHPEFDDVDVIFSKVIVPPHCTGPGAYFHGTAVASIIAGQFVGVAKKPTIVSVQTGGLWEDCDGVHHVMFIRDALIWTLLDIVDTGRQKTSVVNLSWAMNETFVCKKLGWILRRFWLEGITVINCAGNYNQDVKYSCPSRLGTVITVGAMDPFWNRWEFSNFGPYVDIFAPGGNMLVADYSNWGYTWLNDTSFSAPMVAGVAAYLLALEGYHHPWGMLERLQELGSTSM